MPKQTPKLENLAPEGFTSRLWVNPQPAPAQDLLIVENKQGKQATKFMQKDLDYTDDQLKEFARTLAFSI